VTIKGFPSKQHLAKDAEGLGEQVERGISSDERVKEESGLANGERKEDIGFVQLGTASVGRHKLASNEVIA